MTPPDNLRPFTVLFDEAGRAGLGLPGYFRAIYGADWCVPGAQRRPYTYSNFVVSHDGRISFGERDHWGGCEISQSNPHDLWLMGLLRARADAVLIGDNTLRLEPGHVWTHQYIFPGEAENFARLRADEGRAPFPLHIFLSQGGEINWSAEVFSRPDLHVLIATTAEGARRARANCAGRAQIEIVGDEGSSVDLPALFQSLRQERGIRTLLLEGGPRAYASCLQAGVVDEEFLTISPLVVGSDAPRGSVRPGLLEGAAYRPGGAPFMQPLSLRRAGDYFYQRSRFRAFPGTEHLTRPKESS
jgi:riboflavin biosynthesis pyrimidine reductase